MSGPFGSSQWMYSSASGFYPHKIDQSLRFEDGDSPYLNRTFSSGNQQTWTWSAWVKRGNFLGNRQTLFAGRTAGTTNAFGFLNPVNNAAADTFGVYLGANADSRFQTTRVFRDIGWYHLVVVLDTTNGTAADRFRLYVNGVRETVWTRFDTITQNQNKGINENLVHTIGEEGSDGNHFDGYMAEVVFLDGVASDPTTLGLGELKDGIWVAKNVSGLTFGTNGFHLDFADSSAIGNDVSGEDHDFAVSGLAATDVVLDSPTNNFATLNPLNNPDGTFSEGNLRWTSTTTDQRIALATMPVDSLGTDDSYAEVRIGSKSSTYWAIGVFGNPKSWNPRVMYRSDGVINRDGTDTQTGVGTFTEGDIMSITYDVSSGTVTFYKNNSSVTTETVGDTDNVQYFGCTSDSSGSSANYNWNFGQDSSFAGNETAQGNADANGQGDFYYTPPTGFLALCSANLPEPDIIDGSEYFTSYLYTANNASTRDFTGIGFAPNFLWFKNRTTGFSHALYDTVRGVNKGLQSNGTGAENSYTLMTAFGDDGFSTANDGTAGNLLNYTTDAYVAWAWKAGGSAVSNSDGTITSSISANPEAGFSIVSFTHDGTNASTIGHGLGKTPTMIIMKQRSAASNWRVFHSGLADGKNILLNSTDAVTQAGDIFQTAPTSTVFTSGNGDSGNGKTYIAYCLTDIKSYSKAGVYTGTGSTAFIHCGFRPAWVMIRRTNTAAGWGIIDNKRNPHNSLNRYINANSSGAEAVGTAGTKYVDFLSNGFRCISSDAGFNASGDNYIFLAFAEQPAKYSNAR